MDNKCVYFHINPIKKEIFYVGIGNEDRPYSKYNRTKWWHNIVNKYGYVVIVMRTNISLELAKLLEIEYILKFGRRDKDKGTLINLTDGGEGVSGRIVTQDERDRISNTKKGKPLPQAFIEKRQILNASRKGVKRTSEVNLKVSNSKIGHLVDKETRSKISKTLKGKPWTEARRNAVKIKDIK